MNYLTLLFSTGLLLAKTPHAYISDQLANTVTVVDINEETIQTIYGFHRPRVVKLGPDGEIAYIGSDDNTIRFLDTSANTLLPKVLSVNSPVSMALTPKGDYLYVASSNNTITVIRTADLTIQTTIPGFHHLEDIKAAPKKPFIYASNSENGTISVIDTTTNKVTGKITGFQVPIGLALSKKGDILYVVDAGRDAVYLIDTWTYTVTDIISGFDRPKYMVISPDNRYGYVLNAGNNTVNTIQISDSRILPNPIYIPEPKSIAVAQDGKYLYIGSELEGIFKIRTSNNSIANIIDGFNRPSNISLCFNDAPKNSVKGHQVHLTPSRVANEISWPKRDKQTENYKIYRDVALTDLIAVLAPNVTKYTDTNVQPQTTYSYFVVACYLNGFSSTIGSVTIDPPKGPPKPPHPK